MKENIEQYFAIAREREHIRRRRLSGAPRPWTIDPILGNFRFTNVHRENDKTTAWFRENVRDPISNSLTNVQNGFSLFQDQIKILSLRAVEATIIFRWFNRIESMSLVKDLLLHGWDTEEARRRLTGVQPIVTGAYMIHSPYGFDKLEGLLYAIELARPKLPAMVARWGKTQYEAWSDLCTLDNMGSFSAGEVVWDLRWTPVLERATDINTWTIAGPGCAKGLGYLLNNDPTGFKYSSAVDQVRMLKIMQDLLEQSRNPEYWPHDWQPWELHEVEMWCCEYCKYRNAQSGMRLKRRYP